MMLPQPPDLTEFCQSTIDGDITVLTAMPPAQKADLNAVASMRSKKGMVAAYAYYVRYKKLEWAHECSRIIDFNNAVTIRNRDIDIYNANLSEEEPPKQHENYTTYPIKRTFSEFEAWYNNPANTKILRTHKLLLGMEFNGVTYSATTADQTNLNHALVALSNGIPAVTVGFTNGASLVLTPTNLDEFKTLFFTFIMQFYGV